MQLISILLFSKKVLLLTESGMQSVVLKLVILKYFENIELIPTIKI